MGEAQLYLKDYHSAVYHSHNFNVTASHQQPITFQENWKQLDFLIVTNIN
jgi:hypothetical protein